MSFPLFLILSVIQGIAEVLPISSSGHLVIANWLLQGSDLFGISEIVLFHIVTASVILLTLGWRFVVSGHLGTESVTKDSVLRMVKSVGISCLSTGLPVGLAELLLGDSLDSFFSSPILAGVALLVNGVLLFFVSKRIPNSGSISKVGVHTAVIIGLAQMGRHSARDL